VVPGLGWGWYCACHIPVQIGHSAFRMSGKPIIERTESERELGNVRLNRKEELRMKKYQKPALKGLGLLRIATKFSGRDDDPTGTSCSFWVG
jgi:hypothetical protein